MLKEESRKEIIEKREQEIKEQKQLTLDDFVSKSLNILENMKDVEYLLVQGFGKLPFSRPSDNELLKFLNATVNSATLDEDKKIKAMDMRPIAAASKSLVYQSCQFLHDKRVLEKAEVEEPYDICFKLFGVSETMNIAQQISEAFGSSEIANEISKEIKNS